MAAAMVMGSCGKKEVEVLNEAPEWALEENGEKVPYDTERTGSVGGVYFIPIDGKVYRYDSVYQKNVDYKRDDMGKDNVRNCKQSVGGLYPVPRGVLRMYI